MAVTNDTSNDHFARLADCRARHEAIAEHETLIKREIADLIREKLQALKSRNPRLQTKRFTCTELSVTGSVLMNHYATHRAPRSGWVIVVDDDGKFWRVERWLDNPQLTSPTPFTHSITELHLYQQEDLELLWEILT
jgi:hypothetical protein